MCDNGIRPLSLILSLLMRAYTYTHTQTGIFRTNAIKKEEEEINECERPKCEEIEEIYASKLYLANNVRVR